MGNRKIKRFSARRRRPSAIHSFVLGVGSLFDFWGILLPRDCEVETPPRLQMTDTEALRSDLEAIGADYRRAREEVLEEVSVG